MLAANLGIAVLLPLSAVLILLVHRLHPGWLASVRGTVRWADLGRFAALALLTLGGAAAVTVAMRPSAGAHPAPEPQLVGFLVVIVLTSPLQAAAEEVFFRGYLTQAIGALSIHPWVGIVGSATVFALFHGTQNLPLFLNRLAFGLIAGLLVLLTGGLEAPIAAHVVNNALAYTVAAFTGTVTELRGTTQLTWSSSFGGIGVYTLFAVLAYLVSRRSIDRVVA